MRWGGLTGNSWCDAVTKWWKNFCARLQKYWQIGFFVKMQIGSERARKWWAVKRRSRCKNVLKHSYNVKSVIPYKKLNDKRDFLRQQETQYSCTFRLLTKLNKKCNVAKLFLTKFYKKLFSSYTWVSNFLTAQSLILRGKTEL